MDSLLNNHKCLIESGVEIQRKLDSYPATKKIGLFRRPRSTSLGDTTKKRSEGEQREASLTTEDSKYSKQGKSSTSSNYAETIGSQLPKGEESFKLVEKKMKKKKTEGRKREKRKKEEMCRLHKKERRKKDAKELLVRQIARRHQNVDKVRPVRR